MTLEEFEQHFYAEEQCRDYLFQLRWDEGFICPKCANPKAWPIGKFLYECSECGHQTSVIAGTIFQDTHLALTKWFRAIWWVTSQKNGASALGLQRELGIKSYRTSWMMLHKLRCAMVRPGRDKLSGRIEVDEAYIGGIEEDGKRGRGSENKTLIVIAIEVQDNKMGRVRLATAKDASAESLESFIKNNIQPGSTIITDGWSSYSKINKSGYQHEVILSKNIEKDKQLPHVHLIVSLLKRWLLGTLQGAVAEEYLQYYLDEFTFRFNRRNSKSRGLLFYRLLQQAVVTQPVPAKELRPPF